MSQQHRDAIYLYVEATRIRDEKESGRDRLDYNAELRAIREILDKLIGLSR